MAVPTSRRVIHCDCGDVSHYVTVEMRRFEFSPELIFMYVGVQYKSRWQRIKELWNILRYGQEAYGEIILGPDQLREFTAALAEIPPADAE